MKPRVQQAASMRKPSCPCRELIVSRLAPGMPPASSSAWAQQLRLLMPGIERAVAGALEPGAGAVEIRVLGPAGPTWRRERVAVRGSRGPRDTYG